MHLDIEPPFEIIKPEMTEADFYRLAGEDSDWEFLDGRIVMHSPASNRHEDLFRFLLTLLSVYLGEKGGAVVRGSRYPMRLDESWSPEPDLMVIRDSRQHLMGQNRLEGAADFVIEIASESDPRFDLREKLPRYREAGIDEIWLIDPRAQSVRIETRRGEGYATRELASGRLQSIVVGGFWVDVEWLWQAALPPTLTCLRNILGTV